MQDRAKPTGQLGAAKILGWGLLGGVISVVLFYWLVIGIGAIFGGTEVGDGRVPGVGILWWLFMLAVIPVFFIGVVAAPICVHKHPSVAPSVLRILGVLASIGTVAFIVELMIAIR